jgi:hypothetical protein
MARRVLLIAVVFLLVWLSSPLLAGATDPLVFQTNMYGSNVVPPVQTSAWGFVRFFFDQSRTEADYTVDVKGLSGTLVEGADLYRGAPGTNGQLVRHLADGGFIVTSGHLKLSPSELADLEAGNFYVTLSTTAHPEGEIRGQVYVPSGFIPGTVATGQEPTFAGVLAPNAPPATPTPAPLPGSGVAPPPVRQGENPPPAGSAPPPAGPGVRPPNTGDAGLAGRP